MPVNMLNLRKYENFKVVDYSFGDNMYVLFQKA